MNKKQLQENIMAGVKKAFANNKALNEGFGAWVEQNVPKINYDILNDHIKKLTDMLILLVKGKQVNLVQVMYHNVASGSWSTLKEYNPTNSNAQALNTLISDAIVKIKDLFKNDEDKFVSSIDDIFIKLRIPRTSHFMKYIMSTIVPGSNRIKDMAYCQLMRIDDNYIAFKFSLKSLIEYGNEIEDYLDPTPPTNAPA